MKTAIWWRKFLDGGRLEGEMLAFQSDALFTATDGSTGARNNPIVTVMEPWRPRRHGETDAAGLQRNASSGAALQVR